MIRTGAETREELERDLARWRGELSAIREAPELAHVAGQLEAFIAAGERLLRDLEGSR
jgi:hypothetical protein